MKSILGFFCLLLASIIICLLNNGLYEGAIVLTGILVFAVTIASIMGV